MLRLSVTQVGSYLQYINGRITLYQLIEGLTKPTIPTIKMKVGSIFHCHMQDTEHPDSDIVTFDETDLMTAKSRIDKRSDIYEYKIRRTVPTTRGNILLTGVADQIVGNVIHEYKTTFSPFNYDKYAESIQWMGYCILFDIEKVVYQVWQLTEPDETEDAAKRKPLRVKSYHEFAMFGNAMSEFKFRDALNGLVDLVHILDLQDAIKKKQSLAK